MKMDAVSLFFIIILVCTLFSIVYYLSTKKESGIEFNESTSKDVVWAKHEACVAGMFYPNSADKLDELISNYLSKVDVFEPNRPTALISPHAGYVYSGQTAAYAYRQLQGREYDTVIVLAASHFVRFQGVSHANVSHYETPLGLIPVSEKVAALEGDGVIKHVPEAHVKEHSLEVQLPFLQKVLGDFKLVPLITGDVNPSWLSEKLDEIIDDKTLVVASTDLSHYYTYDEAHLLDQKCVADILHLNSPAVAQDELCSKAPVLTVLELAKKHGWSTTLLDYRNSGDTAGDKNRVVGYVSVSFHDGLNPDEQKYLLDLSRQTVSTYLSTGKTPKVDESKLSEKLKSEKACFVTLHKHGNLRGCIGHLRAYKKLYECVIENTVSAMVSDSRFPKVAKAEETDLDIEISVLSDPETLEYDSSSVLLEKLVPKRDGVILKKGARQSTYLPQVWDQLPDKKQFLTHLCEKAGLRGGCWKEEGVSFKTYQAHVFSEGDF